MSRWKLRATPEQWRGIEELMRSSDRGEADRARGVWRSLAGERSPAIAQVLGVRADQVRRWRGLFRREGVQGLRSHKRGNGLPPVKANVALPVVEQILSEPPPAGVVWTVARLAEQVDRRTGTRISASYLTAVMRKRGASGVDVPVTR